MYSIELYIRTNPGIDLMQLGVTKTLYSVCGGL